MANLTLSRAVSALAFCGVSFCSVAAHAAWPDGTIKFILPFAAGGSADVTTRLLANKLSEKLSATIIVENRAGASGMIGTSIVAKAKPDGQTFLVTPNGPITIVPQVQANSIDTEKELTPVSMLVRVPVGVAVSPTGGMKTVKDLIAFGKANPDQLSYGIPGIGTYMHLVGAMFAQAAEIKMTAVPFAGSSQAAAALLGGHVRVAFADLTSLAPLRDQGVKILAITDPERTSVAPELPTVAEEALPGYGLSGWIGLFAPAGTPADIVVKVEAATREVMRDPEVKATLARVGLETAGSSASDFKKTIASDIGKLKSVIKAADIKGQQ